ncbi:LPO_1073/Vpar_1526 family protein [Luteibacter yeojuensis]
MSDSNDQVQKVGSHGVALQAAGSITYGLSLADMKQLAIDLYDAQMLKLQGVAEAVARERADQIRSEILEAIRTRNPEGVQQAADVDFQHALYGVQRDYARTGDEDLGKLLVDLLVERTKATERDIMQLVLNQALETAAKLSTAQIAAIAVVFVTKNARANGISTLQQFLNYVDVHLLPMARGLKISAASVQYIAAANCGMLSMVSGSFGEIFVQTYPAFFRKGFTESALPPDASPAFRNMLMPCLHDQSRLQVRAETIEVLDGMAKSAGLSADEIATLQALFNSDPLSGKEVEDWLVAQRPDMKDVIDAWTSSGLHAFQLNSVGQAIGHARIRQHAPEFADLAVWVN